tara:strand:- start:12 stop:317 length:306 start_codon:yes stop_codon:yes gene_type:complete
VFEKQYLHMGKETVEKEDWKLGTIFWFAVVVWFSSSLLSQAVYMAFYGVPYDAIVLLKQFGPLYYAVMIVELFIWAGLASVFVMKVARKIVPNQQTPVTTA